MADVIDLFDSDDEEVAKSRPTTKKVDIVDLYHDDSDDDDVENQQQQQQQKQPAVMKAATGVNNRSNTSVSSPNISATTEQDGHSFAVSNNFAPVVSQETRPYKRRRNGRSTDDDYSSDSDDDFVMGRFKNSMENIASPNFNAKETFCNPTAQETPSSSGSISIPLQTSVAASITTRTVNNPYAKQIPPSSSQESSIMASSITMTVNNPCAKKSPPSSQESHSSAVDAAPSSKRILANPYAKKKPPPPRAPPASASLPTPVRAAATSTATTRKFASSRSRNYDPNLSDDSEDDDAILFDPNIGLGSKKKTAQQNPISCSQESHSTFCSTTSSTARITQNPYAKAKNPPPSPTTAAVSRSKQATGLGGLVVYPTLLANSKMHPDLRARFLLAFWHCARQLSQNSHQLQTLDRVSKKMVSLAFEEHPVRSVEEYAYRIHSGATSIQNSNFKDELQKLLEKGGLKSKRITTPVNACSNGKYYTIVEACIVSIFVETQRRLRSNGSYIPTENSSEGSLTDMLSPKDMWVSLKWLLAAIDTRLHPDCPHRICRPNDEDNGVKFYTDQSTRSAEYLQIKKLCVPPKDMAIPYLKQHKFKKQIHFELTCLGYKQAQKIQSRIFPKPSGYYRVSNVTTFEPKYKNICLGVDFREGGVGDDRRGLHQMCNKLDMTRIPYFVGCLYIGDYCFFHMGMNKLCPLIVERKSIQDVALSISDGRWKSQKQRMYHGQYVFGYDNCRIAYIIEGKEERQQVTGGYICQRRFNVTRERFDEEVEKLKKEGFEVIRTSSVENSMFELSRVAKEVGEAVQNEELRLDYTYEEFKREVKKIPKDTDFSRLAIYAMEEKQRKQLEAKLVIDTDSDIEEVVVPSPKRLNYAAKKQKPRDTERSKKRAQMLSAIVSSNKKLKNSAAISSNWRTDEMASIKARLAADDDNNDMKLKAPSRLGKAIKQNRSTSREPRRSTNTKLAKSNVGLDLTSKSKMDYSSWTAAMLQKECVKYGLPKNGTKQTLIERLQGPKPPPLWVERKKMGEYVPRTHDCAGAALLVALLLLEEEETEQQEDNNHQHPGFEKEVVYMKAEELCITKNPFSGGTTQTGPYHYDGWSSMKQLLGGDPALVVRKRNRFRLTRHGELAGYPMAKVVHRWCHEYDNCCCANI